MHCPLPCATLLLIVRIYKHTVSDVNMTGSDSPQVIISLPVVVITMPCLAMHDVK